MQPESCDDEGDYQRANERRETECAFIWYAWMCACVNERATERKNQRHRERERERKTEWQSIQGRKKKRKMAQITNGRIWCEVLKKKRWKKTNETKEIYRYVILEVNWKFEHENLTNFFEKLQNLEIFGSSESKEKGKREENRIGRNVNSDAYDQECEYRSKGLRQGLDLNGRHWWNWFETTSRFVVVSFI